MKPRKSSRGNGRPSSRPPCHILRTMPHPSRHRSTPSIPSGRQTRHTACRTILTIPIPNPIRSVQIYPDHSRTEIWHNYAQRRKPHVKISPQRLLIVAKNGSFQLPNHPKVGEAVWGCREVKRPCGWLH